MTSTKPEVLRQLHEEHRNIARLLAVLERELGLFDRTERPDYDVLTGIAAYFTGFPDRCHHPKENLVLEKLRERDPEAAALVGDLDAEHERIGALARHFREAVKNVLQEVEVSRSAFDEVIRHFIREQRRHMEMEERDFFPLAEKILAPGDWAELEARAGTEEDPLFGPKVAAEFEALRENILRWEREDQA